MVYHLIKFVMRLQIVCVGGGGGLWLGAQKLVQGTAVQFYWNNGTNSIITAQF